jgi:ATP-binding cassette subfamily F protein 3
VQISNWLDNDPELGKKAKESIFDLKKEDITYVDSKKLEKIEAKLKQKNEKRENKSDNSNNAPAYDASKSASASQAISRKAENFADSSSNRSFDVIIENFDVSFGNK